MAVLKVVLNHWGLAVVGDRDSGSTGFPDIDWDSPAWRHAQAEALEQAVHDDEPHEVIGLRAFWTERGSLQQLRR